eukprot:s717_g18.t1
MESPLLRAGVAAAQNALRMLLDANNEVKTEGVKSEEQKDVSGLEGQGDAKDLVTTVPLDTIYIVKPPDMPCIEDWVTCCISFLFSGKRLRREPLDLNVQDVLKMATRFEMMLKERMKSEAARDQNESEMLQTTVSRYNSYQANAAIKKWQISQDQFQAMWCIIVGLDEISRSLLRSHLGHNKWGESGSCACFSKTFIVHCGGLQLSFFALIVLYAADLRLQ